MKQPNPEKSAVFSLQFTRMASVKLNSAPDIRLLQEVYIEQSSPPSALCGTTFAIDCFGSALDLGILRGIKWLFYL